MAYAVKIDGTWIEKTPRQFRTDRNASIPIANLEAEGLFEVTPNPRPSGKVSIGPIVDREGRPVQTWIEQVEYATAADAKAAMVQWIDRMTAKVLSRYPESVRVRWPEEEAAARAVKAGTATSEQTALITDEGAAKGRTPTEHADIIIGHADNFRAISGEVNKLFLSVDAALDAETDPAQYEVILDDAKAQAETLATAYGLG